MTRHHRFLLQELLDHLEFVEAKIVRPETMTWASCSTNASWAGLCPGNWKAGTLTSGQMRKGSAWLRRHRCQCAWAVSTKRHTYLSALFRRLAARRGVKRASIVVAHAILTIAYRMIRDGLTNGSKDSAFRSH